MKACFLKKLDESLLTNLPPFRSLTEQQIREILDSAQTARYDAGKPVFAEGRAVDRFFLLLDGHVRVQRTTSEGDQIILLHIAPGQLFGIGAALGHKTYPDDPLGGRALRAQFRLQSHAFAGGGRGFGRGAGGAETRPQGADDRHVRL